MNLDLDEKIAIVTGGASNIGRAICMNLAKEGANVIVADLDTEQGQITSGAANQQILEKSSSNNAMLLMQRALSPFRNDCGKYST